MFAFRARSSSSFSASDFRRRPIPRKPIFVERRSFLFFFSFGVWCYYIKVCIWSVSSTLQIQNSLSVKHLWFLVGVSLRSILLHTPKKDFFTFQNVNEKDNKNAFKKKSTSCQKRGKTYGKKISQKSRVKKGGTKKEKKSRIDPDTKKTTDDLLESRFGSIDRSIDYYHHRVPSTPPSTKAQTWGSFSF